MVIKNVVMWSMTLIFHPHIAYFSEIPFKKAFLHLLEKMKLEKLNTLNKDAHRATQYLRNNRNMFQNDVFEPFVMCANVHDLQFSKYLENAIHPRDMTAFFFTNAGIHFIFLPIFFVAIF